jgi:hypothetical protein
MPSSASRSSPPNMLMPSSGGLWRRRPRRPPSLPTLDAGPDERRSWCRARSPRLGGGCWGVLPAFAWIRYGMPRRISPFPDDDTSARATDTAEEACHRRLGGNARCRRRQMRGRRPGPAPGDGHNEAGEEREGRDDQRRRNARLGRRPGACRGNAPHCLRGRPDRSWGAPRQGRCRLLGHDLGRTARSHRRLAGGAGRFLRSIGRRIPRGGRPARTRAAAATRCHLGDGCQLACHRRRGAHSGGDPAGPALVVLAARGLGARGRRVKHCRGPCRPSGCACAALRGPWRSPPRGERRRAQAAGGAVLWCPDLPVAGQGDWVRAPARAAVGRGSEVLIGHAGGASCRGLLRAHRCPARGRRVSGGPGVPRAGADFAGSAGPRPCRGQALPVARSG